MAQPGVRLLRAWLKATGWTAARLARVCGFHRSCVSQFLTGYRPISLRASLQIAQATRAAYDAGEVKVQPLAAADLCSEAVLRTGTDG